MYTEHHPSRHARSIGLQAGLECSMRGVMQGDVEDVSEQYLELVCEHLHRFRDALAVHLPPDDPDRALIELPDVGWVQVPRRRVTDLLEFQRTEPPPWVDERQLDLLSWREEMKLPEVDLPPPPLTRSASLPMPTPTPIWMAS